MQDTIPRKRKNRPHLLRNGPNENSNATRQCAAPVSGACFIMGQAVGIAANLTLASNSALAEISVEAQQELFEKCAGYLGRA